MEYEKLKQLLSEQRLQRYAMAVNGSKTKTKKLYRANLRVSQAFYPVLNVFEVVVRNSINDALKVHFDDGNWIITESQSNGFMQQEILGPRYFLKKKVQEAERNLQNRNTVVTSGGIVAEQSFGFWKSLFQRRHFRLLQGSVMECFPNLPSNTSRDDIHQRMLKINKFRNRVYHNEPICFDRYNNVNFQIAESVRTAIYELLQWMGNGAENYLRQYDNISNKIAVGQRL